MRVLHVLRKYNPAEWGGTETALQRLFEGLRQHRVESVVYCPRLAAQARNAPGNGMGDPLAAAGCRIRRFNAVVPVLGISQQRRHQMVSVGGNLISFDLIPALWREPKASIMHTHTLGRIGGIALTVARWRGIPLVLTVHGGVLDLPQPLKDEFATPVEGWEWGKPFGLMFQSRRLFPLADAILTCNGAEAQLLRRKYPNKRIVVQPHGVRVETYRRDFRQEALAAFPAVRGRPVLLCVGRVDPVKNQDWLVRQAPAIFQRHPEALLVLAGACTDEAYGQSIRRQVESLGCSGRVLFTGGLPPNDPRLIGLLQHASVLLVPSKSETFGLVILEAWAAGTAVISSRTSGASALVRHGENGWIFDLENSAAFHAALDEALARPELARRIVGESREEVGRQYSVEALAGRMKRLYEELIEEKNALRHSSRRRYQCADAG